VQVGEEQALMAQDLQHLQMDVTAEAMVMQGAPLLQDAWRAPRLAAEDEEEAVWWAWTEENLQQISSLRRVERL